jgi:hypothetical protein
MVTTAGRIGWCAVTLLWVGLAAYGFGLWSAYEQRPGEIPDAADGTVSFSGPTGVWRVLMFVHPHCPCSQASVLELRRLLHQLAGTAAVGSVQAVVFVVRPPDAPAGWEQGELLHDLSTDPEVSVALDSGGQEAKRWKAATSGHVIVLDPQGRLRFRGGITPGRGQQGSSLGSQRIMQMIQEASRSVGVDGSRAFERDGKKTSGEPMQVVTAPVYGCPLWTPGSEGSGRGLAGDDPEEARGQASDRRHEPF